MWTDNLLQGSALFWKSRRTVTGKPVQKKMLRETQHPDEELRGQASDDTKEHGIEKEPRPVPILHANFLSSFCLRERQILGKFLIENTGQER